MVSCPHTQLRTCTSRVEPIDFGRRLFDPHLYVNKFNAHRVLHAATALRLMIVDASRVGLKGRSRSNDSAMRWATVAVPDA
jgi:hypothetical protein